MGLLLDQVEGSSSPTPGPQWGLDTVANFTTIDSHDHASGSGVQVPTAGINITADLPFNGYGLSLVDHVGFGTSTEALANLYLYSNGTDLYFQDGAGNTVRLTASGSVNAVLAAIAADLNMNGYSIYGLDHLTLITKAETIADLTVYSDGTNLFFKDSTGAAVQLTSSSLINTTQLKVTTPLSTATYTVLATDHVIGINTAQATAVDLPAASAGYGRDIYVKDKAGTANTHNITITPNGADTIDGASTLVISASYGSAHIISTVGGWMVI
jgi:hypothetical protein